MRKRNVIKPQRKSSLASPGLSVFRRWPHLLHGR